MAQSETLWVSKACVGHTTAPMSVNPTSELIQMAGCHSRRPSLFRLCKLHPFVAVWDRAVTISSDLLPLGCCSAWERNSLCGGPAQYPIHLFLSTSEFIFSLDIFNSIWAGDQLSFVSILLAIISIHYFAVRFASFPSVPLTGHLIIHSFRYLNLFKSTVLAAPYSQTYTAFLIQSLFTYFQVS